jgi:hypothetical protein
MFFVVFVVVVAVAAVVVVVVVVVCNTVSGTAGRGLSKRCFQCQKLKISRAVSISRFPGCQCIIHVINHARTISFAGGFFTVVSCAFD